MSYFATLNKETWEELGNAYEMLKPVPLTQQDINRSLIIADDIINNYAQRQFDPTEDITFGNVLKGAVGVYYSLGMHTNVQKAVSILQNIQYQDNQSYNDEKLTVQSMLITTGAMISKRPAYIEVPRVFTNTSIHFMAHEIAHMLKEGNPYECKGIHTDAEVIPILIEMISAHKKGDNNVFKKRELIMLDIAQRFKKLHEDLEKGLISQEDMFAFKTCYRQHILYLNSFYYSLRLFIMYLEAPRYVLGIIDDVLSHKLTTKDVITNHLTSNSYEYETGMQVFRNRLK